MTDEIKNPLYTNSNISFRICREDVLHHKHNRVVCVRQDCLGTTKEFPTYEEAVIAWNKRYSFWWGKK